jgi:hypothetical protein
MYIPMALIALIALLFARPAVSFNNNKMITVFPNGDTTPISQVERSVRRESGNQCEGVPYNKAFLYVGVPVIEILILSILICDIEICRKRRVEAKMTQVQMSENLGSVAAHNGGSMISVEEQRRRY